LVRPWTKKPHLYLLPYPLPPIGLGVVVVAAHVQEHELRMLVLGRVVVFFPFQLHAHLCHLVSLVKDVGCPGVSLAQIHVLAVAVLAFVFPVGRHRARRHCHWRHWRHWLHCHCSPCLILMSRLQGLVSYPVPILWIVFCNTGGMRYEVFSTCQYHILFALCETIRH